MHIRAFLISLGLAGGLAAFGGVPAYAQFYNVDGAYRCLIRPDAHCSAEAKLPPPPPPPAPVYTGPTMASVIADIRTQKLSEADMRLLEAHAIEKEPRAVEAMAWCKLYGIGWPADPLAAYFLYGEAAELGVPNARANQVAIFESRLTLQQRQDLLMKLQTR